MKSFSRSLFTGTLLLISAVFACVTINIYFPAEKVEAAAEEIVDDIRGRETGGTEPGGDGDQGSLTKRVRLCLAPSVAHAEEATEVSNPTIRALKERMKSRYRQMKPYYDKGLLKEGKDGFVAIKGYGDLGLKEKRDLNALVEAENKDRKALYQEVARALKIDPSQVDKVAETFAKEWRK
jgi:uncharacterized protein YdbL (DUF1318 family)